MKKNSKISNLNLKFLDLKFVSINHNQTYITQALQSCRRSKISELPSLLKSTTHQFNDTTVDDSMAILKGDARKKYKSQNSESSFINTQNSYSQQYSKILLKSAWKYQTNNNIYTQSESGSQIQIKKQSAQLEKYRRKIQKLKKQNKDIHNQISLLYRNKLKDKYQPLKQVRKIQPFVQINEQTPISSQNASKVFQEEKQSQKNKIMRNYWNFYQNLTNPLNPYNEELQIAQKKMLNNNLHRNFQNYCQKSNKRIPQFIKKIR